MTILKRNGHSPTVLELNITKHKSNSITFNNILNSLELFPFSDYVSYSMVRTESN